MINFRNITAGLVLGLVVTSSAPVMARTVGPHPGYAARAQALETEIGGGSMTPDRAKALRECNGRSAPLREYTWGEFTDYQYRECMTEHGQVE